MTATYRYHICSLLLLFEIEPLGVELEAGGGGVIADRPYPRPAAARKDRPDRGLSAFGRFQGDFNVPQIRRDGPVEQIAPISHLSRCRKGNVLGRFL